MKRTLLVTALAMLATTQAYGQHQEMHHEHGSHATADEETYGRPADQWDVQKIIRVEMRDDLEFSPSDISVKTGQVIRFDVVNVGKLLHEMVIGTRKDLAEHGAMMKTHPGMHHDEPNMVQLQPGKSGSIVWQFTQPGDFYFACLVDGHFEAGMFGKIHVTGQPIAESNREQMKGDQAGTTHEHGSMEMNGAYGPYTMAREASGTSWQPDSSPDAGIMAMGDRWMTMTHGIANLIYDHQGGPRGASKTFSNSMLMMMAQRQAGDGTLALRGMVSADPLMGKSGYPELFQTGETANGSTPLIDRQHPHDLFMELSASYSLPLSEKSSVFAYAGLPGEPALGPPTFMHRFSGEDNPEAPITHHWLDSTHITYGVVTLGYVYDGFKIEGSAFRGREPDQYRYNIETGRLDSGSMRFSYNPAENWSFQVSRGHITSPEQLEPDVNVDRTTASAMYNRPLNSGNWQTTVAFGRNEKSTGGASDAYLLESAVTLQERHTLFARAERVEKDELFLPGELLAGEKFRVGKLSAGYIYDLALAAHFKAGIGGLVSEYAVPATLKPVYGGDPASFMLFARIKIQ